MGRFFKGEPFTKNSLSRRGREADWGESRGERNAVAEPAVRDLRSVGLIPEARSPDVTYFPQSRQIVERVAIDHNDVGALSGFHDTEFFFAADEFRGVTVSALAQGTYV